MKKYIVLIVGVLLLLPSFALAQEKKFPTAKVGGYVQTDYYLGDAEGATVAAGATGTADADKDRDSSFFIRRARLGVKGAVSQMITFGILGGFDGGNSATTRSSANLLDGWINLKFDPAFQVKIGQFKYTFDREGKESGSATPFAMRPAVINDIVVALGQAGGSFRDIGIEIHGGGKAPIGWKYAAGVLNGNGIGLYDNNKDKDLYARVEIAPIKELSMGGGYYTGKFGNAPSKTDESAYTVDAQVSINRFTVRGAYYKGEYEVAGAADKEPEGWYVVGSVAVIPTLDILARYQTYESDSNKADYEIPSIDIGVNYYFDKKALWGGSKLVLNYMIRDADKSASSKVWEERGVSVKGDAVENVFIARLQATF